MRQPTQLREEYPTALDEFEEIDSDLEDDLDDDEEWIEGGIPARTEGKKVLVG
jgi:hypothetical protein